VFAAAVVLPESTGTVRLSSTDPNEQPKIDNNFLATERDQFRMLEAVKLSRRLARGPVFGPCRPDSLCLVTRSQTARCSKRICEPRHLRPPGIDRPDGRRQRSTGGRRRDRRRTGRVQPACR
jgi:GMC oxidoreductase